MSTESAQYPVPPAPQQGSPKTPLDPQALRTLLALADETQKQKRLKSTRAVNPSVPIRYELEDGTVFLIRPMRHGEQKAMEAEFFSLKGLDQGSPEDMLKATEIAERVAKKQLVGWENLRDEQGNEVHAIRASNSEYPLTEESLEMISLNLLRQIGADIINNGLPSAADLGKSKPA